MVLTEEEYQQNIEGFRKQLPDLAEEHAGLFALVRDGEVVFCFDSARDAFQTGRMAYGDSRYLVHSFSERITYRMLSSRAHTDWPL